MNKQNRNITRNPAMKFAKIFIKRNGSYYDCHFSDINSQGGRVNFDKPHLLADRVDILIQPENISVMGRIAWKGKNEFGVHFERPLSWLKKHDTLLCRS